MSGTSRRGISRRTLLKYGATIGVGAVTVGNWRWARAQAKKPILIGLTCDASGTYADSGDAERRGAVMAIDEFNAKGGLLGRTIEYKHEDTETEPSAGARKAKRLIERERVDFLIGGTSSAVGNAISELAQQAGIVYIDPNCSSDARAGENCHRVNFNVDANNYMFGHALAPWVAQNMGKRWLFLTHDYTFGKTGTAVFRQLLKEQKGEEVGEILVPMGQRDFSAQLIKIQNMKPDVVMVTVAGADLIAMIEQATEFGLDKKVPFCFTLRDYTDAWAIGLKGNFGVFGVTWYHFLDLPGVKDFIVRYKKRWPKSPIPVPENVSYNGYIGTRELLRAVERAGTTRSHEVIKALEGWKFADNMKNDPTTIRDFDHQFAQTMYVARAKRREQMKDETDLWEILGSVKPEVAAVKKEDSKCKMEPYSATPAYQVS